VTKIASTVIIVLLTIPVAATGAFYPPVGPDPAAPPGTAEGSGIQSGAFTYAAGDYITFDSIFITNEPTNTSDPDNDSDWFGVGLFNATAPFAPSLELTVIGDVGGASSWLPIDGGAGVTGPNGDSFLSQTDYYKTTGAGTYSLPNTYAGQSVKFGIGVFDLNNASGASALLVDNILWTDSTGAVTKGFWDFDAPADPWSTEGFFYPDGGPAGLFEVLPDTALPEVTKPGSGNYAYLSTFEDELPVPAPTPVILLASGLILFVGSRRRSSHS